MLHIRIDFQRTIQTNDFHNLQSAASGAQEFQIVIKAVCIDLLLST